MENQQGSNEAVREEDAKQEHSSIFRSKSIDRISSPDQLNDYIRVATPRMWAVLIGVLVLLAGTLVWAALGYIESKVQGVAIVTGGECTVYIAQDKSVLVSIGDPVRIYNTDLEVTEVSGEPFVMSENFPEYARKLGGFSVGEWICAANTASTTLPDGIYPATVTEESISPLSFLTDTN